MAMFLLKDESVRSKNGYKYNSAAGPRCFRCHRPLAQCVRLQCPTVRREWAELPPTPVLMTALQALNISGEFITTTFTFPATVHALSWRGITPVCADIDPDTMTLDPRCVEPLITEQTSAGDLFRHARNTSWREKPCSLPWNKPAARSGGSPLDMRFASAPLLSFGARSSSQFCSQGA